MKDNETLEELLNGYLDGQLDERQCTEIKRLMAHDPEVAKCFTQLQKSRQLIGLMPRQHAPDELLDNVKADLERTALLSEYDQRSHKTLGVVHLYGRKLLSVAAMLLLLAILGAVIYKVVAPAAKSTNVVMLNTNWKKSKPAKLPAPSTVKPQPAITAPPPQPAVPVQPPMRMELELATAEYAAVTDHIIKNVIVAQNLLDSSSVDRQSGFTIYTFNCTRSNVGRILDGLETVWPKFTGSKFVIGPDGGIYEATVGAITLEQIMQITTQRTDAEQIKLASDFAMINSSGQIEPNALAAPAAAKVVFATQDQKIVDKIKFIIKIVSTN